VPATQLTATADTVAEFSGADDGASGAVVSDGKLSADELIELRSDLFNDTNGAPHASNTSVVVVAPMDPVISDPGYDDGTNG